MTKSLSEHRDSSYFEADSVEQIIAEWSDSDQSTTSVRESEPIKTKNTEQNSDDDSYTSEVCLMGPNNIEQNVFSPWNGRLCLLYYTVLQKTIRYLTLSSFSDN